MKAPLDHYQPDKQPEYDEWLSEEERKQYEANYKNWYLSHKNDWTNYWKQKKK